VRLEHILDLVYARPWLITPQSHANIRRLLDWKLSLPPSEFFARKREGEDSSGGAVELPSMIVDEGIAFIPFGGVLLKGATAFEKGSGGLAHEDVSADIQEALADDEVAGLFFDTDSPGGTAAGTPELAEEIAEATIQKPCFCWVERLCCSAAFYSLAGCTMIYGGKSSEVGAVECYMAWVNSVAYFQNKGLKVEIIKPEQSTHAGAGYPGTDLTEDQRAYLLSQCEDLLAMFVDHLGDHRSQIVSESMRGQTFIGEKAKAAGFLDAVTTKAQAVEDLRGWIEMYHR
jgi:ClpP class serine protease